MNIGIRKALD